MVDLTMPPTIAEVERMTGTEPPWRGDITTGLDASWRRTSRRPRARKGRC